MKILLIHGDNQVESRGKLAELKEKAIANAKEVVELDGDKHGLTDIIQALETQSLFADERMVFIEKLYSARKKNDLIIEYFKGSNLTTNLVVWEQKKVDGRKIGWINNKREFSYPQVLFRFLESIGTPSKLQTLNLFQQALQTQPVELVYFMIVRQFRLLLLVKFNSTDIKINETGRLQPWQLQRLSRQAELFDQEKLKRCYRKLLVIDYQQKTGQAALGLKQMLDIFLAQL